MTTNAWAMLYGTLVMGCIALFRGDSFAPQWTMSYMGALVYLALFGSVIAFGAYFTWSDALVRAKRPTVPCSSRWWRCPSPRFMKATSGTLTALSGYC